MPVHEHTIGTPAIVANLIKYQCSRIILRHLRNGWASPVEIARIETTIAPTTMRERLRTMVRYNLIRRTGARARVGDATYRLTPKGRRVLSLLEVINYLDLLEENDPRPLEEVFDPSFRLRPELPLVVDDRSLRPEPPAHPSPAVRTAKLA